MQTPIPLGFYLARRHVSCSMWPQVTYRGVDRLLHLPSPDEVDHWRSTGKRELADLWDRYDEAQENGTLNVDYVLADRLLLDFQSHQFEVELIYVELSVIPKGLEEYPHGVLWAEELERALAYIQKVGRPLKERPQEAHSLGYDLAHPIRSFHSAIFQPGLHKTCPLLPQMLNKYGLFFDLATAMTVLDQANALDYGGLPFCILEVFSMGED